MECANTYLEKLKLFQLKELAEFIVNQNFNHHCNGNLPANYNNDSIDIYKEELKYFNSSDIFIARGLLGEIIGSIRILKWNYKDKLPLQKIFHINPLDTLPPNENYLKIWHIGRFAITKGLKDKNLLKKLMVCAISPICEQRKGIAFAECDSKLLRTMNLLGIETKIIGKSITYLGSETIPVSMKYEGLRNFYQKNKHLIFYEPFVQKYLSTPLHKGLVPIAKDLV